MASRADLASESLSSLWTRHKWARAAVKVWAAFLVVGGVFGFISLRMLDPAEYDVSVWGPLMFLVFIAIGLGYFLTANRYIKVEEVPA